MTSIERCDDRARIERLLRMHRDANVYALADLDDQLFAGSRWWIARSGCRDVAVAFVMDDFAPPLLTALDPTGAGLDSELLDHIADDLPDEMFVNLMDGGPQRLAQRFWFDDHGPYDKFVWHPGTIDVVEHAAGVGPHEVVALTRDDLDAVFVLQSLTPDAGRAFTPEMLADGVYVGIRDGDDLVAMAGTHVVSDARRVAAIGNVLTRPDTRGRGHGTRCTAEVLRLLSDRVDAIGLNCSVDRPGARRIYQRLGFTPVMGYVEGVLTRRA